MPSNLVKDMIYVIDKINPPNKFAIFAKKSEPAGYTIPTGDVTLPTATGLSQPVPTAGLKLVSDDANRWGMFNAARGAWERGATRAGHAPLPSPRVRKAAVSATRAVEPFRIVSPADGATYLIDPTLRREFQTVPLKIATDGTGSVEWQINGRPLGSTAAGQVLDWALVPGRHHVTARDARGRTAQATITVR